MQYQFHSGIRRRVQAQIKTGSFETEDDVLREAITTLERRQRGLRNLQNIVREADEDVASGRVDPFDAEETKAAVRERLATRGDRD